MILIDNMDSNVTLVRPGVARLTAINATQFKTEIVKAIEEGASTLIIDFSEVEFFDSSGLGALVGVLKKIGHRGEVVVCGLNENLTHIFKLTRMDRVFPSFANKAAAHQSLLERP